MTTTVLEIEVIYARSDRQVRYSVQLPEGATIQDAIEASDVLVDCPEVDLTVNRVGIYGKLATLITVLRDQDRVEILRPLLVNPREARRQRAAHAKKKS